MTKSLLCGFILLTVVELVHAGWREPVRAQHGMVVTAEKQATRIGVSILQQGGNAVDAAVAVGFALAVTYPQAGNIGGGGFMVIRTSDGASFTLDYREKAPGGSARNMYLDEQGNVVENASTIGYLAAGVPGSVAGLYSAHKRFGKLPWKKLVQPAVDLAGSGFPIERDLAESLDSHRDLFSRFPASLAVFTRKDGAFQEGDTIIQTDLAATLKLIQEKGPAGFYEGPVAEKLAADMQSHGGIITTADLKDYEAVWRDPIEFTYRGYKIISMPPPSSGGILLAACLNTLENINPAALGHNSSPLIHFWIETLRHIYADRSRHLGDSDFYDVPVEALLSKSYGKKIFSEINAGYAANSLTTHPYGEESTETTHFSIVDSEGNAVANTTTLNGSYGSGVVIDGCGFLMNNEMDDFAIKPGYPNIYGLVGDEANAITPEKRMLSSMTPTIIEKDGRVYLVLGSPGGGRIITAVAQVISNVLDHKMNIREAIEMPRFHHQWLPDETDYEDPGFARDVIYNLEQKGHVMHKTGSVGCVQAILKDGQHDVWTGWSDPRRNGSCQGY